MHRPWKEGRKECCAHPHSFHVEKQSHFPWFPLRQNVALDSFPCGLVNLAVSIFTSFHFQRQLGMGHCGHCASFISSVKTQSRWLTHWSLPIWQNLSTQKVVQELKVFPISFMTLLWIVWYILTHYLNGYNFHVNSHFQSIAFVGSFDFSSWTLLQLCRRTKFTWTKLVFFLSDFWS